MKTAPSAQPRVLHLIETLGLAGAAVLLTGALPPLQERGYAITIRALTCPDRLEERLRASGIDTDVLWRRPPARVREFLIPMLRLRRHIIERRYDIIHAHLFHTNLLIRLVAPTLRGGGRVRERLVTTLHSSYHSNLANRAHHRDPIGFSCSPRRPRRRSKPPRPAGNSQ